jgi:hypothetical protein
MMANVTHLGDVSPKFTFPDVDSDADWLMRYPVTLSPQ